MKTQVEADATRFNPTERPPGLTPAMGSRAGSSGTDALYLEVPIRVLGTCARAEDGAVVGPAEPFDEETVTMVLLPRGAVVRLAARVTSGQDVMLLNKQINRYINCSVVKIRSSPEAKQYVEIEFTHSAPNFWGFSFPKEAARAAVAEPAVELPQRQPAEPCADAPWIVPKKALAVAAGAAGSNAAAVGVAPAPAVEKSAATYPVTPVTPLEPDDSAAPTPFFTAVENEGMPLCEPVLPPVGLTPAPAVGAEAECDLLVEPAPRRSGMRRAMAATALLCAAFWGYRIYSATEQPLPTPVEAVSATDSDTARSARESSGLSGEAQPTGVTTVTAAAPEVSIVETPRRLTVFAAKVSMPEQSTAAGSPEAPEIPTSAGGGLAPAVLLPASGEPQPPPPAPEQVVKPAPVLTPARLVSTVQPIYPSLARQANIEGNVTVEAQIDSSGSVTGVKVLSGPTLFQRAAAEAVAKWKFEPARLGDKPAATSMALTVRFVRR